MAEYWDLYDADRRPTGLLHRRGDPVPEGCYHLVAQVWIRNSRGEFLVSQRHPGKPFPLYWECTGGAVTAGEDARTGALREVEEELGLRLPQDRIVRLRSIRRKNDFVDVWLAVWDGETEALRLQEAEVTAAEWVSYAALCEMDDRGEIVPTLRYFRSLFGGLQELPAAVCPMTMEDYGEVYALWSETPGMGLNSVDDTPEGIGRFLRRNPGTCFVAKDAGGVIGTVLCGHDGRRGHLYHAAVLPRARGRGVGRALVNAALDALRDEGIAKASLLVFADNDAGCAFWRELGFSSRSDIEYLNIQLLKMEKIVP